MSEIIQVHNLRKEYDNNTVAVNDISFGIKKGTIVAITGRSGSGKSTLLQMLGLLDKPTKGTIVYDNKDVSNFDDLKRAYYRRTRIGFVYQNFNLLPEYSIRDNICLPVILDKKQVDEAYFQELVTLLGISTLLAKQPYQLSGGEQQRVAIARAFIIKPSILLADEPTGNLDKLNGDKVMDLMLSTAKTLNTTVLFVTHDLELASQADTIINMSDGRIV